MTPDEDPLALLAAIGAERERLRAMLAGRDEPLLAERPPSGKWSVLENVRHLLFAEQSHLGRFQPGGRTWSPLGLPPTGMQGNRRLRGVGEAVPESVTEVLDAWAAAHAAIRPGIEQDTTSAARAMQGNLRHLRAHIKVIERLLRAQA
ncbi:MAG: DinB family protein [Dehalococcoidia bacterium]